MTTVYVPHTSYIPNYVNAPFCWLSYADLGLDGNLERHWELFISELHRAIKLCVFGYCISSIRTRKHKQIGTKAISFISH